MHSILLVGDSGRFADIAERIGRKTHCRLLSAGSGADALTVSRQERPDLIFLDAEMPGMTGYDVCRVLKADSRFTHTPVVVLTDRPDGPEDGQRAGADEVVAKPLDEAAIFDCIRRHLRLFPRDDERAAAGWPVTFWREGVQHDGTMKDLSRGGFFLRTPVRQPVGARLEIAFDVPGETPGRTVVAEALVVRVAGDPDRGLGCRFFRVTASSRATLDECLQMLDAEEARPSLRRPDAAEGGKG
jgi:CheY-like chemotaxis protein